MTISPDPYVGRGERTGVFGIGTSRDEPPPPSFKGPPVVLVGNFFALVVRRVATVGPSSSLSLVTRLYPRLKGSGGRGRHLARSSEASKVDSSPPDRWRALLGLPAIPGPGKAPRASGEFAT